MVFTPEITSVNQRVQIGAESTSALGTSVSAGKILQNYDVVYQPKGDTQFYRPVGRKYPNTQEQNDEWMEASWGGTLDYNSVQYILAGIMGSAAPVAHGASTTAKDWIYTPPVTGTVVPQTYTVEQGDSNYAKKSTYNLFTDFGYTLTRKSTAITAKSISQAVQLGITMTNSPVAVALAPVPGKHLNIYIDTASGNLGTTLYTKVLQAQYSIGNVYTPFWPINRANASYTSHVDTAPAATMKILLEADSTGMALLTGWEAGTTYFMRVNAQGNIIDNLQTVTIGGGATGGTFTLGYKGVTTSNITYSAGLTAATVNTAFQGLSTVGSNCTVTGSNGGPYTFTFSGALASDMSPVIATNVALTGGTPTITSVAQAYNVYQHDMAMKLGEPSQYQDKDGVYAIEFTGTVVEDATWAKAQTVTVTNLITAL